MSSEWFVDSFKRKKVEKKKKKRQTKDEMETLYNANNKDLDLFILLLTKRKGSPKTINKTVTIMQTIHFFSSFCFFWYKKINKLKNLYKLFDSIESISSYSLRKKSSISWFHDSLSFALANLMRYPFRGER